MTRLRPAPRLARRVLLALAVTALAVPAAAHDLWVQTNTPLARTGDAVHVDLMLGNHGNRHRDYKLASKIDPAGVDLSALGPGGRTDLKPGLVDAGLDAKEGFWTARLVGETPGLRVVALAADRVVNHGTPTRAVASGKTYVLFADSLDAPSPGPAAVRHDEPLGHSLELVPLTHPVLGVGPGRPVRVRLLFRGEPLAGVRVAFLPRGRTLEGEVDPLHEPVTDADGVATFTPDLGTYHLVAARHVDPTETGPDYARTAYTATLTLLVPERPVGRR